MNRTATRRAFAYIITRGGKRVGGISYSATAAQKKASRLYRANFAHCKRNPYTVVAISESEASIA